MGWGDYGPRVLSHTIEHLALEWIKKVKRRAKSLGDWARLGGEGLSLSEQQVSTFSADVAPFGASDQRTHGSFRTRKRGETSPSDRHGSRLVGYLNK